MILPLLLPESVFLSQTDLSATTEQMTQETAFFFKKKSMCLKLNYSHAMLVECDPMHVQAHLNTLEYREKVNLLQIILFIQITLISNPTVVFLQSCWWR